MFKYLLSILFEKLIIFAFSYSNTDLKTTNEEAKKSFAC